jgi:hypothetical protein
MAPISMYREPSEKTGALATSHPTSRLMESQLQRRLPEAYNFLYPVYRYYYQPNRLDQM